MCKGRLWIKASLSIGAPLGKLEWSSYTGDIERRMKEGSRNGAFLSEGANEGNLMGGLLMLSKAVEMGVCFHKGPDFGEHWETLPSWGL